MDEFDQQVKEARLAAEQARVADETQRALDEEAAERVRSVNDQARLSLEIAWRRVHAALMTRNPDPDALFVSNVASEEMEAMLAAEHRDVKTPFFRNRRPRGLRPAQMEAIQQRNRVRAWALSEQLGLYVSGSEIAGTFSYRAFLAADGRVYCVDGYTHCAPDRVSSYIAHFGPGEDILATGRIDADHVLYNYAGIKAGLANLVVKYNLQI